MTPSTSMAQKSNHNFKEKVGFRGTLLKNYFDFMTDRRTDMSKMVIKGGHNS